MKKQCWAVEGVHEGKSMSELPITYLLWFVGSPVMRRVRWEHCQIALSEIRRRLVDGPEGVEADLVAGLRRKTNHEQHAMRLRREAYQQPRI